MPLSWWKWCLFHCMVRAHYCAFGDGLTLFCFCVLCHQMRAQLLKGKQGCDSPPLCPWRAVWGRALAWLAGQHWAQWNFLPSVQAVVWVALSVSCQLLADLAALTWRTLPSPILSEASQQAQNWGGGNINSRWMGRWHNCACFIPVEKQTQFSVRNLQFWNI